MDGLAPSAVATKENGAGAAAGTAAAVAVVGRGAECGAVGPRLLPGATRLPCALKENEGAVGAGVVAFCFLAALSSRAR